MEISLDVRCDHGPAASTFQQVAAHELFAKESSSCCAVFDAKE